MTTFDPHYGELLSARETCEMTGLTMNQLRNWRLPARHDKAPFGYVSIGTSPYYRKSTITTWIERNGGTNRKYVPLGIDHEIPIAEATAVDFEKQNRLRELAKITTENVYHGAFSEVHRDYSVNPDEQNRFMKLQPAMYAAWAKVENTFDALPYGKRASNFGLFYAGSVLACRRIIADRYDIEISDQELMALPIGDVPPRQEVKK